MIVQNHSQFEHKQIKFFPNYQSQQNILMSIEQFQSVDINKTKFIDHIHYITLFKQNQRKSNNNMDDNNYFLQDSQIDSTYQLRAKIKYLQQDIEKLQVQNNQMTQNIQLLRSINKQLSKSYIQQTQKISTNQSKLKDCLINDETLLIQKLTAQNTLLESSYLRVKSQNKDLSCRNLMLEQIIQETQLQQKQILKGYESKIIQLRRSIQFKESCIQSYQQSANSNNSFEVPSIPPSNFSMLFFNEIDDYKGRMSELENKLKTVKKQLKEAETKITKLQSERNLVDLMMKSREGYNQIRERITKINKNIEPQKMRLWLSQGKLPYNSNLLTNSNENSQKCEGCYNNRKGQSKAKQGIKTKQVESMQKNTQKSTFVSNNNNNPQLSYQNTPSAHQVSKLNDQLKKTQHELLKLSKAYQKEHQKRKQLQQKLKTVLNSNQFYKQKRQTHINQLNYYKQSTHNLISLLQKRNVNQTYSLQKNKLQNFIHEIKKPTNIQSRHQKQLWLFMQAQLNNKLSQKTHAQLKSIQQKKRKLKKSLSDILTYTSLTVKQNIVQQQQNSHHQRLSNKNKQSKKESVDLDDFSRILGMAANGEVFDEQSLLIKPKVSYAERKKIINKNRSANTHDLTIIANNIL